MTLEKSIMMSYSGQQNFKDSMMVPKNGQVIIKSILSSDCKTKIVLLH